MESASPLSNKTHLPHKTLKPSKYGVNTKATKQCRKYGNGVREVKLNVFIKGDHKRMLGVFN